MDIIKLKDANVPNRITAMLEASPWLPRPLRLQFKRRPRRLILPSSPS